MEIFFSAHELILVKQIRVSNLEEHGTDEGQLLVDGGTAEDVSGSEVEGDVLDHVGKKLEVVHIAHKVVLLNLGQSDEYILKKG